MSIGADAFADAPLLEPGTYPYAGPGLSREPGEPVVQGTDGSTHQQTAWWRFVPPYDGYAVVGGIDLNNTTCVIYRTTGGLAGLELVTWAGPNYQLGPPAWMAEEGETYYLTLGDYDTGANRDWMPTLSFNAAEKLVVPAASVAPAGGAPASVVGGAGALSTESLDSYVDGDYDETFVVTMPAFTLPTETLLGLKLVAIGETAAYGGFDLHTDPFFAFGPMFYSFTNLGNYNGQRISPFGTTPTRRDRSLATYNGTYPYTYVDDGLTLEGAFNNSSGRIYYLAWEIAYQVDPPEPISYAGVKQTDYELDAEAQTVTFPVDAEAAEVGDVIRLRYAYRTEKSRGWE